MRRVLDGLQEWHERAQPLIAAVAAVPLNHVDEITAHRWTVRGWPEHRPWHGRYEERRATSGQLHVEARPLLVGRRQLMRNRVRTPTERFARLRTHRTPVVGLARFIIDANLRTSAAALEQQARTGTSAGVWTGG
jgi:hypothetical protein